MLRDQFANHFEVAEFFNCDILKHVPNSGIFHMERLHPVLQGCRQFARGSSKLLEKVCSEARIGRTHIDGLNQLFAV